MARIVLASFSTLAKAKENFPDAAAWVISRQNPLPGNLITHWTQALAPTYETLMAFKKNHDWEKYTERFLREIGTRPLARTTLNAFKELQNDLILCCFCPDETICHRSIIAGLLDGGYGIKTVNEYGEPRDYTKYWAQYKALNPAKWLLVCGSRTFTDAKTVFDGIELYIRDLGWGDEKVNFLTGNARGADCLAEQYADMFGHYNLKMPANWKRDGRGAGMERNRRMFDRLAELAPSPADRACLAFWDLSSPGTRDAIHRALEFSTRTRVCDGTYARDVDYTDKEWRWFREWKRK